MRTIKKDRRGLESDRYKERSRRRDDGGRVVDIVDSRDDASGGMTSTEAIVAAGLSFSRFRRRCGSSSCGNPLRTLLLAAVFERSCSVDGAFVRSLAVAPADTPCRTRSLLGCKALPGGVEDPFDLLAEK